MISTYALYEVAAYRLVREEVLELDQQLRHNPSGYERSV
jgi:hypothetical protein